MKKFNPVKIYPFLCRTVLLPALICSFAMPAEVSAAETTAADTAAADTADTAESSAAVTAVPELVLSKCYLLESENYDSLADGYYQAVLLTEESAKQYPALSTGLAELNTRIAADCKEDFKKLAEDAKLNAAAGNTAADEKVPTATLENKIVPVRIDDKAVSFFTSCYSYLPSAAHGMTTFQGITLDCATGKEITLDQVIKDEYIKDKSALVAAVNDNLRFVVNGKSAGDREESISVAFASVDYSPSWVLSNNGVIFRFNPEAIGTYADGAMEAEISFSKYPDLFTGAYGSHTGAYTLSIDAVAPIVTDLKGDGTAQIVSLNARPNENGDQYSYTALRVAIDDKECLHETYFFSARGILLHTADAKNYLYVQTITDNDYRILSVFDLNGETPEFKGELNGTGFAARYRRESETSDLWYLDEQLISSPDSFVLDTKIDLMSTYSAFRRYKVGENGIPEPLTEDYEINSDLTLTSITDLPADIVDPATGAVTKKSAILPKGTKCSLYRTNGKDTVDLITEAGTVYRFTVTEKWPQKVNGLRLDQAFEGTMFAG